MRDIANIHAHDAESRLNLRQQVPQLTQQLGFSPIISDRIAILACELAALNHDIIIRLKQNQQQLSFNLCTAYTPALTDKLQQLCEYSSKDRYHYQYYSWKLQKIPELDWKSWKQRLEAPSKASLMRDLQERAEDLKQKNQELEESTRLKSEFLANMSHELRTPMNSIIGFTGRVLKKSADKLDARQLKNLHTVERNAHHLLGLINDLLDISKVEAGRMELYPEHTDLEELLHEVRDLTNSLWQDKGIDFYIELSPEASSLYIDRVRLKQVLINLVSNAVKFTEQGSVRIHVQTAEDMIVLSVADTGIGIQKEDLDYIFEAFRQADGSNTRAYGGTGLGLNISKNFIELMGGHIEVSSVYGQGSCFSIYLPKSQKEEQPEQQESKAMQLIQNAISPKKEHHKATVLCIDDNADVLELFRQCLNSDGYHVVCASSGDEGIRLAKERQPAAITLDVQMPHRDGWSVLQELKATPETKNIPVLMATMMDNKALGIKLGAVAYLEKPIVADKLLASIKQARLLGEQHDILLVDDDTGVRELMQQIFEDAHLHLRLAIDGLDGLNKMREKQPDLVILDLMMPQMDGFEVIRQMQQDPLLKTIPIMVSTAKPWTKRNASGLNNMRQILSSRVAWSCIKWSIRLLES